MAKLLQDSRLLLSLLKYTMDHRTARCHCCTTHYNRFNCHLRTLVSASIHSPLTTAPYHLPDRNIVYGDSDALLRVLM